MPLDTILWLALLVVLGVLFTKTFRRMSTLTNRTRDLEQYQQAVEGIDLRFAAVVDPMAHDLDMARRNAGNPQALREDVASLQATLAGLVTESRTLAVPRGLERTAQAMTGELERAARAADLVEHGLGVLGSASRGRDLEAQTSLKRGALNLRHSRDAFGRMAREVGALRPVDLAGLGPGEAAGTTSLASYPGPDSEDVEGRFDPRM